MQHVVAYVDAQVIERLGFGWPVELRDQVFDHPSIIFGVPHSLPCNMILLVVIVWIELEVHRPPSKIWHRNFSSKTLDNGNKQRQPSERFHYRADRRCPI